MVNKLSKGEIIGNNPAYIKDTLIPLIRKLDMNNDIFVFLRENFDKLYSWSSNPNKTKLIEIIFRIKNKLSNDEKYFINSELNYLKLIE